ncbi:type II toxin-antitoxin system RelE/ParE family toxin [Paenibacillus sp. MER TA 81-3]|uniref:type II toxin-antitoxin system RelE family toxin n=1 Tax=Paenibacillus sp. MER TA 81-3 TaxID=2939573 RepID=UPI00203A6D82|nr:type II toxin-antitoxin system RelE/ParE family toxin [Paenibacillus sp. MER TA 81-3]MCM3342028.1 type II toxin-antitoxin system RelE/ParE family toxin [Paenibacillus sp. MER TA 81-3]
MNSTYRLTLSRDAVKFVAKQEKSIQLRIRKALLGLSVRPPVGDIKPLKGKDKFFRLRVGSYRVIFEVNHKEQVVCILTMENRGDIY